MGSGRNKPAHGVVIDPEHPTIVFLTVCTRDRQPWLATEVNHLLLREIWQNARAWIVGRYVLMPDHLHLFAAPGPIDLPLENWVRYWKSQFSKRTQGLGYSWQVDHWDRRLRREENYDQKWDYVRNNPVRAGLVLSLEDWPFQGELNSLRW